MKIRRKVWQNSSNFVLEIPYERSGQLPEVDDDEMP